MAKIDYYHEDRIISPTQVVWRRFKRNPFSVAALIVLTLFVILMIVGPIISPYDPMQTHSDALLLPPSWFEEGVVDYFFGTDALGRDLFSRLLYGTSLTFASALFIVFIACVIGTVIGSLAGVIRGVKSSILNHFLDVLLSIPSLIMAILIVAATGPGLTQAMWAVGLSLTPQFIRSIHNAISVELQKEYVTAARLDGANLWQIYWFVVLPNIKDTIVLSITTSLSTAILDIAALGFLGLGAQSPSAEWGSMLSQGMDSLLYAPWTVTLPGLAIFICVLATNVVGDGLRFAMEMEV